MIKKLIMDEDLPDLKILSDSNDVIEYVLRQASKGKKITTKMLSKQYMMPIRSANEILNTLEQKGKLKSTMMRVLDEKNKPVRMKVFSKK